MSSVENERQTRLVASAKVQASPHMDDAARRGSLMTSGKAAVDLKKLGPTKSSNAMEIVVPSKLGVEEDPTRKRRPSIIKKEAPGASATLSRRRPTTPVAPHKEKDSRDVLTTSENKPRSRSGSLSMEASEMDTEEVGASPVKEQLLAEMLKARTPALLEMEARWRKFFNLAETEDIVGDWSAALIKKGVARQGRLYVFAEHVCFHSTLFGQKFQCCIPFSEVIDIERIVINLTPGIMVATREKKYRFGSVYFRAKCYTMLRQLWSGSYVILEETSDVPEQGMQVTEEIDLGLMSEGDYSNKDGFLAGLDELHQLIDDTISCTPTQFFKLLCSNESTFEKDYHLARGDWDIEIEPWKQNPPFGMTRNAKYCIKLTGPVGPPTTRTEEIHRYHLTSSQLNIDTSMSMLDAPYGDYFRVESHWIIQQKEAHTSSVKISAKAIFSKSTILKGTISSKTLTGMTESFTLWMKLAKETLQKKGVGEHKESSGSGSSSVVASPSQATSAPVSRASSSGFDIFQFLPRDLDQLLKILNVVVQILIVLSLWDIRKKLGDVGKK